MFSYDSFLLFATSIVSCVAWNHFFSFVSKEQDIKPLSCLKYTQNENVLDPKTLASFQKIHAKLYDNYLSKLHAKLVIVTSFFSIITGVTLPVFAASFGYYANVLTRTPLFATEKSSEMSTAAKHFFESLVVQYHLDFLKSIVPGIVYACQVLESVDRFFLHHLITMMLLTFLQSDAFGLSVAFRTGMCISFLLLELGNLSLQNTYNFKKEHQLAAMVTKSLEDKFLVDVRTASAPATDVADVPSVSAADVKDSETNVKESEDSKKDKDLLLSMHLASVNERDKIAMFINVSTVYQQEIYTLIRNVLMRMQFVKSTYDVLFSEPEVSLIWCLFYIVTAGLLLAGGLTWSHSLNRQVVLLENDDKLKSCDFTSMRLARKFFQL